MTENEQLLQRIQELETALKLILEEEVTQCCGFETKIITTARVALGMSEKEFWD